MKVVARLLAICVLAAELAGCAYVEYRRVYELHPHVSETQRLTVGEVVERYFLDKGLLLQQKYRDVYPERRLVSALEIPRRPEEKRRHAFLFVVIADGGVLQLIHSEWYLRHTPDDFVAESKRELLTRISGEIGANADLRLAPSTVR
jgi:hypothetical protein